MSNWPCKAIHDEIRVLDRSALLCTCTGPCPCADVVSIDWIRYISLRLQVISVICRNINYVQLKTSVAHPYDVFFHRKQGTSMLEPRDPKREQDGTTFDGLAGYIPLDYG